jgi:putative SOS response-associated peptidase YedK
VKAQVRIARKDSKPLLVAGLWNRILTPDGPLEGCTIVTRPPTPDLEGVHDRMPALLLSKDIDAWLDAPPHQARTAALSSWQPRILTVTPA